MNSHGRSPESQDPNSSLPARPSPTSASHQPPSQRSAPLSHGELQQVPLEAWASNNSHRPGADPALYQGRRSQAIWPHSCPGGLTFPAPFQRNPTPCAPLSLPQPRPAFLPAPQQRLEWSRLSTGLSLPVLGTGPGGREVPHLSGTSCTDGMFQT